MIDLSWFIEHDWWMVNA